MKRKRVALSTTKRIAKDKLAEPQLVAASHRYGHKGDADKSWRYCVDKYLAWSKREMDAGTHSHNIRAFTRFETAFHPKTMAEITPARLNELKHIMEDDKVRIYARERAIRALKAGIRRMEIDDNLPPQRWDTVRNVKLSEGRTCRFEHAEMVTILKACRKPHWKSIVLLGSRCGLRGGEMEHLLKSNLLWDKGEYGSVDICHKADWSPKCGKARIVPMTKEVRDHLLKETKRMPSDHVIADVTGHRPAGVDSIGHVFKKILKAVEMKGFLHKLRHTYGSDLARAGCSSKQIAVLMGHASPRMSERYMHLSPEDVSDKAKLLKPFRV
jgi:integrase